MSQPDNLPALPDEENYFDTGLDDLEPSRRIPRLRLVHKKGVFLDTETNQEFPFIEGVPLGLVRQRVMWNRNVNEGDKPLCKSNDGKIGYPNIDGPAHCDFPWDRSGTTREAATLDEFARPTLSCESCAFAQWGPPAPGSKKSTPPACSERYTIPLLYATEAGQQPNRAGVVSFQRSGIAPLKAYMSVFKTQKKPLFAAVMQLNLQIHSRGTVDYSVPYVRQAGPTSASDWPQFAEEFRRIREILQAPPMPPREEEGQKATQPAAPRQDDPWSTTTTANAQAWPQTQATAPTQPAAQTVVQAQVVQAAPVQQQPVQATVVPASSMPATAAVADDDELPF